MCCTASVTHSVRTPGGCAKSILDCNGSVIPELQLDFGCAQAWRADLSAPPTWRPRRGKPTRAMAEGNRTVFSIAEAQEVLGSLDLPMFPDRILMHGGIPDTSLEEFIKRTGERGSI